MIQYFKLIPWLSNLALDQNNCSECFIMLLNVLLFILVSTILIKFILRLYMPYKYLEKKKVKFSILEKLNFLFLAFSIDITLLVLIPILSTSLLLIISPSAWLIIMYLYYGIVMIINFDHDDCDYNLGFNLYLHNTSRTTNIIFASIIKKIQQKEKRFKNNISKFNDIKYIEDVNIAKEIYNNKPLWKKILNKLF